MNEQWSITFTDSETGDEAYCSVRRVGQHIGFAISLAKNGDVEVFLSSDDLERLLVLLERGRQ